MNLDLLLVHLAELSRVVALNDGWGGVTNAATVSTVSCFLHGADARKLSPAGDVLALDFEMWLSPATSVAVNDAVANVTAPDGTVLLERGRIVSVKRHHHPVLGFLATQARIVRD